MLVRYRLACIYIYREREREREREKVIFKFHWYVVTVFGIAQSQAFKLGNKMTLP
jgi:hypothetical protein